jgi:CheY-like chemotaxis protein
VDDYPDAVLVWTTFLDMCGFEVVGAGDGQQAVELAHAARPDLAVLDLDLPGLSGCDVARSLRLAQDTSGIPLIAVTGHSERRRIEAARQAGFDLVLTKPCEPNQLLQHIERLLAARDDRPLRH